MNLNVATLRELIAEKQHYTGDDELALVFYVPVVDSLPAAGMDGELVALKSGATLTVYVYNLSAGQWETIGEGVPATTVTDETSFGISKAVGTGTKYAREDHTHGTPSDTPLEKVANKGAASGYASLDATTKVPTAELGTGTASSSTYLRGDRSWQAISVGGHNKDAYSPDEFRGVSGGSLGGEDGLTYYSFPTGVDAALHRSIKPPEAWDGSEDIYVAVWWAGKSQPEGSESWYARVTIGIHYNQDTGGPTYSTVAHSQTLDIPEADPDYEEYHRTVFTITPESEDPDWGVNDLYSLLVERRGTQEGDDYGGAIYIYLVELYVT